MLDTGRGGRVLIVDDRPDFVRAHRRRRLSAEHTVDVEADPSEALFRAAEGDYDLVIVSLNLQEFDGLRLCSQLRSLERTRNLPILASPNPTVLRGLLRGLEIGVNDYLVRPIDRNEMLARVRTQMRKSATPSGCATTCRCRSRWRSPTV